MLLRSRFFPGPSNHFPAAPLFGRFSLPALPVRFAHPAPLDECDLSGRFQLARTVYELRRGACSPVGQARQRGQLFEASYEHPATPLLRAHTQVPRLPIAVSRLSAARRIGLYIDPQVFLFLAITPSGSPRPVPGTGCLSCAARRPFPRYREIWPKVEF